MKSWEQVLILYIMAALMIFGMSHITTTDELPLELAIKMQLDKEQLHHIYSDQRDNRESSEQILKRKRRYLEFPEGTSFQLGN